MTDASLKNKYQEMIEQDALKKSVIAKKLEKISKSARDQAQKMMLGDDGRVGEAVIMSFFNSLYGSLSSAYNAYKEHKLNAEKEALEKGMESNKEKIDRINQFKEKSDKINDFTRLSIQKAALEQKLKDTTLDEGTRKGAVEKLSGIAQKIDDIAGFYEITSEMLSKEVETMESKWYGEDSSLLRDMRIMSPEIREKLLPGVSLDDIIDNGALVTEMVGKVTGSLIENELAETIDKLHSDGKEQTQEQELK